VRSTGLLLLIGLLSAAPGISASPSEDNLRYFNVMILGPTSSPYEGKEPRLQLQTVGHVRCTSCGAAPLCGRSITTAAAT